MRGERWRGLARSAGSVLVSVATVLLVIYLVGRLRGPSLASAPPVDLVDLRTGQRVSLEAHRGRPVVLNFWASWCGPCRLELPALGRFARRHPEVVVLGISHDEPEALVAAAAEADAEFPQLHDVTGGVSRSYGVTTLPTTVALDAEGAVVFSYTGMLLDPHLVWLGLSL